MALNQSLVNIFTFFDRIGVVDVVLPFILVFTIVYGILEKTLVLGKNSHNTNVIVATVLGFLIVMAVNYVNIITDMVRLFVLLVIMALAFALIYGIFGSDIHFLKKK